jgi:transcriptional regulator with XRE-family HTH domain
LKRAAAVSESVGARIRRLRKECGMSAVEIARRIRMNDNYLRQVERGEHEPGLFMATELAKLFNVSLDYLACRTDKIYNPYLNQ